MPSLPELRVVHEEMLELLKRFDTFCAAHDVRYTLDAGTLLGAVREHGFIPWDDDTDVAITRAEYEKFRAAARKGPLPEYVVFSEFSAQHPRVWLRRPNRPGAWIDLFIMDYITDNPSLRKLRLLGCAFMLAFTKNRASMEITRRAGLYHGVKAQLLNLGYLMGRPFSQKLKAHIQDAYCKHAFHGKRRHIHRCNDNYAFISMILPAEVMQRYERMRFEDAELMVSSRWHEMLVSSYGEDYMTPKRMHAHDNPAHAGFINKEEN